MPKIARIILDSGCFLKLQAEGQTFSEIGYFQCDESTSDFSVVIDDQKRTFPKLHKLAEGCGGKGDKCTIEVRHKDADGAIKTNGVKFSKNFHAQLLQMKDLYGKHVPVNPENFDCVIRFESGNFTGAGLRKRVFKKHRKSADGKQVPVVRAKPKPIDKPIMHDAVVSFSLASKESIEFARNGVPFWSIKAEKLKQSLVIKILADDSTSPKYFGDSFEEPMDMYALPNASDPPPSCPSPPCLEGS